MPRIDNDRRQATLRRRSPLHRVRRRRIERPCEGGAKHRQAQNFAPVAIQLPHAPPPDGAAGRKPHFRLASLYYNKSGFFAKGLTSLLHDEFRSDLDAMKVRPI